MLDAVLSPEAEYRHYSFNARWRVGQETALMAGRRGSASRFYYH